MSLTMRSFTLFRSDRLSQILVLLHADLPIGEESMMKSRLNRLESGFAWHEYDAVDGVE